VVDLAEQRGVTPAQLALAWVMAKGNDIVPIPGTKSPRRLEENAAAADLKLSAQDIEELDNAVSSEAVHGDRYPSPMMALLNQ
jgi:aryl-alcohol dehydrogenase-like predicted oxidoreductase